MEEVLETVSLEMVLIVATESLTQTILHIERNLVDDKWKCLEKRPTFCHSFIRTSLYFWAMLFFWFLCVGFILRQFPQWSLQNDSSNFDSHS